jgi:hypothetical protein
VNSSAIPYCPPGKPVYSTQLSAARRELDWSAASARLLFDGDDAVLRNTVRNPSRRGHRSQSAAAARFLCGQTSRRRSAAARLLRLWVRVPPGAWMSVCCECCVLSGRGFCDELITRPEESYRLWCVVVCDLETSWMRGPGPTGGCCAKKKITVILPLCKIKPIIDRDDTVLL